MSDQRKKAEGFYNGLVKGCVDLYKYSDDCCNDPMVHPSCLDLIRPATKLHLQAACAAVSYAVGDIHPVGALDILPIAYRISQFTLHASLASLIAFAIRNFAAHHLLSHFAYRILIPDSPIRRLLDKTGRMI